MQLRDPVSKSIRVFVSSTFQDMWAERDALISTVFPAVRAYCRKRDVEFIGIDLRWGITAEQSRVGATVDICMAEIDRCRPYFIGILGERYGWIPPGAPVSVTEQEIIYGALGAPEKPHAFFYLRAPRLTTALYGAVKREPRQAELRRRIRNSGFPCLYNYASIDAFSNRVLADLLYIIDMDFPLAPPVSQWEAERQEQWSYAAQLAGGAVGREEALQTLTEFTRRTGLTLVTGGVGMGKTSLLARWAISRYPGDGYVFLHFSGVTADGGWEHVARRIIEELSNVYALGMELPGDREGLRRLLPNVLSMAAKADGRILLIIDNADALCVGDSFGWSWLPSVLPDGVRIVLALDDDDCPVKKRAHQALKLTALSEQERRMLIRTWLAPYGKALDEAQTHFLAGLPQTGNPQYLCMLLNEIRHVGLFETLTRQIEEYGNAANIAALSQKVLERFQRDYDRVRPGLTGEALSWLVSARGGLTENEWLALLGDVPRAIFSPLHIALESFLITCGGEIRLYNTAFRTAVAKRFLPTEEDMLERRRRLALWYAGQSDVKRKARQLPWLMEQCGDGNGLYDALSDTAVLRELWNGASCETKRLWALAKRLTGKDKKDAYQSVLSTPEFYPAEDTAALASLLMETGDRESSLTLLADLVERSQTVNPALAAQCFGLAGNAYMSMGRLSEASQAYSNKVAIAEILQDSYERQRALGNLGLIRQMQSRYVDAQAAYREMLTLARQLHQPDGQQAALQAIGNINFAQGNEKAAEQCYLEQLTLCEDSGNVTGRLNALGSLGVLCLRRGDPDAAERYLLEQERLSTAYDDPDGLQTALGNLAVLALNRGDAVTAKSLWERKVSICTETGAFLGMQNALGNLARLALTQGDTKQAVQLCEKRERLCREHRARRQLAMALHDLALAERADGQNQRSEAHEREACALAKQNGFVNLLQVTDKDGQNESKTMEEV
jgi:tetratricopeptide (TPR) repeat protein